MTGVQTCALPISLEVKGGQRIVLNIGIASYAPEMTSYKDLIERAQTALHRVKEEGGDHLCIK